MKIFKIQSIVTVIVLMALLVFTITMTAEITKLEDALDAHIREHTAMVSPFVEPWVPEEGERP